MGSSAISSNLVSAVVGYILAKGNFNPNSPNLPQTINIFGEANTANQSGLSTNPVQMTSAKQAATLYGYGSPLHDITAFLLRVGVTIPIWAFPQLAAVGAVAKVITITPTGTATANGTVKLVIAGRTGKASGTYDVNIANSDTPTMVCDKIRAATAAVLECPMIGTGTTTAIMTSKWAGLTSNDLKIRIDTNGTNTGVTFAVTNTTAGSGTPSVATSLNLFANDWRTMVINSYGLVATTIGELETFNGVPDPISPTGRFAGTIMKPMWAFSGTTADDPTSITGDPARKNQVTIVACPAPLSEGMPYEAAANMVAALWSTFQNNPQNDILYAVFPDMPAPAPGNIPQMTSQTFREFCVKNGCSTVDFYAGTYRVVDLVTTYNLDGEYPPFYRYVRDLNVHYNFRFRYYLKEQAILVGKTIAKDTDVVNANNVIKPKQWKAEVSTLVRKAVEDGLLVDADFTDASIVVQINTQNPNRLDTTFDIKISGVARQSATTVTGGFNFSN